MTSRFCETALLTDGWASDAVAEIAARYRAAVAAARE